jgi:hypothetical protein
VVSRPVWEIPEHVRRRTGRSSSLMLITLPQG